MLLLTSCKSVNVSATLYPFQIRIVELSSITLFSCNVAKVNVLHFQVRFHGVSRLPFVDGLGHVERRTMADGRAVTSIYPKTMFKKTRPIMQNIKEDRGSGRF